MKRQYASNESVLKAARKVLGGYLVTYDGTPALAQDYTNDYGQVVTRYLTPQEAAEKANLDVTTALFAEWNS